MLLFAIVPLSSFSSFSFFFFLSSSSSSSSLYSFFIFLFYFLFIILVNFHSSNNDNIFESNLSLPTEGLNDNIDKFVWSISFRKVDGILELDMMAHSK